MRHHRRVLNFRFLVMLVVVSLAAAGCGDRATTGNATIDYRNHYDAAYEAVAAAQIAKAIAYSEALLQETSDPEVKAFARG